MFERVIVPATRFFSEALLPGVSLERFYPGGKEGPNGEIRLKTPGGQGWSETILIGDGAAPFQMALPDIRLPANQLWPSHWHDCWTAVVIVEGQCLIGEWVLDEGDVFIAAPCLEYGPLVIGPEGCRLFEIFAQAHLSPGGYAPEYRDHPTLQNVSANFADRLPVNAANAGRQSVICGDHPGLSRGRLAPGAQWDLGEANDPMRGIMQCSHLAPQERRGARTYGDWAAILVMDGTVSIAGRALGGDDLLLIRPQARLGELSAGADGADLLELSLTARA